MNNLWFIIIQFTMLTPHQGKVIVSSDQSFYSKELCDKSRGEVEPNSDKLIKSIFGKAVTYENVKLTCSLIGGKDA